MNFNTILGSVDFLESLRGKTASFLLNTSVTKTCEIPNISQAGIPGKLYLTPTLDSEFLCVKQVRSLEDIAQTPKGVPTPALITRAVHELKPYKNVEIVNLGLQTLPKIDYFKVHNFDLNPSEAINKDANINAMDVFQKGVEFAQNLELQSDYVILGESVPSGTTTAYATAKALGYEADELFSSSFKNSPDDIRTKTINEAMALINEEDDVFARLSKVSDNMLIFTAGFILGSTGRDDLKVVLAGGTQMASALLIANSIVEVMGGVVDAKNIALCTTKWIYEDENSDIKALLEQLNFSINAYASDFDFSLSSHPALKLYDEGEAKEGVGCGGALCYASINGVDKQALTNKIESFLG